ncbi:unnamed protein product [Amoebophrya sp. A120]|nr:unnamed protein product [Amoebophrya sp. A120]|eukprot:GSA120T00016517001.1
MRKAKEKTQQGLKSITSARPRRSTTSRAHDSDFFFQEEERGEIEHQLNRHDNMYAGPLFCSCFLATRSGRDCFSRSLLLFPPLSCIF